MSQFLIYIIRWAVVLTMLYSLYGLIMKRETLHSLNRVVLLSILIASMVLPLVQMDTKEKNIIAEGREMLEQQIGELQTSPLPLSFGEELMADSSVATAPLPSGGTGVWAVALSVAILIYLIGLVIAWLRYLVSLAALLRFIHQGKRMQIDGLPKGIQVLTHPAIKAPCSWMRWVLLNPADANLIAPLSTGRRVVGEGLLRHELSHIHYGHSWDMLFCEFTCRMLWCVPFAWMLRQDLRDVHEFQVDRRVLQNGIDENEYQLLLIRKATTSGLQPVVNALNQSPIKRRFQMMYKKPSRRWVALKAAYLLPLSALALVAFARPQTMSEIEKHVDEAAPAIAETVKTVAKQLPSLVGERQEAEAETPEPSQTAEELTTAPTPIPTAMENDNAEQSDSNLVKADLRESGFSVLSGSVAKTPVELLDSTMQAVGARKIADGTYIGHFQPSLNSDTVRIALATILDRQSQQTGEHRFAQNANDSLAYNITLNAETRKGKSGYYIRYLQPVSSTLRRYDHKPVDPKMLSTDSVLTGRRNSPFALIPAAIERNKKETRIYLYFPFFSKKEIEWYKNASSFSNWAIVDESTGDKYVCRSTDSSYFKHVHDMRVRVTHDDGRKDYDTVSVYQMCLVFPPLSKKMHNVHLGHVDEDIRVSDSFVLNDIPRKGRIITN